MTLFSQHAKLILGFSIALGALIFLWPNTIAYLQSSKTAYAVKIDMPDEVVIACLCKGKLIRGRGADEGQKPDGRTSIKVSVANADDIPLNYEYAVAGNQIYGNGPNAVWDFMTAAPGEYLITVTVDDGVGNKGRATKKVRIAEPHCYCPCECPLISVVSHYTEVKAGDTLDFEVRLAGGGFVNGPQYNWTLENGVIASGQGTAAIVVKPDGVPGTLVTATVNIGGVDRNCGCALSASESVAIGTETKTRRFPLSIEWISVDEDALYIECAAGIMARPDSKRSDDLVVDVRTGAVSNSVLDKLNFTYTISGGKMIGSGANVKWDLSGLEPGTYTVSVDADDGKDGASSSKKSISLYSRDCTWTPECTQVDISDIRRAKDSNDFIVSATVAAGPDVELEWEGVGADVIAGQGSRLVRLRPRKNFKLGESTVTLTVDSRNLPGMCRRSLTERLQIQEQAKVN